MNSQLTILSSESGTRDVEFRNHNYELCLQDYEFRLVNSAIIIIKIISKYVCICQKS